MRKINCIHYEGLCEFLLGLEENKNTSCEGCSLYLNKNKIIELPMEATDKLKEELTKYCYERCVDEL